MTAVMDIPLPLADLPPGPHPASPGTGVLRAQIQQAERAETRLRRRIEDLEEEADFLFERIAECRREIATIEAGPFDSAGFDLRLPLVEVSRKDGRVTVRCSACGPVMDAPMSGTCFRENPYLAARQHALDAHDGLVDAEGWAR